MAASVTPIEMPAEGSGTTTSDRPEDGSLLHAQPRMLLEEGVTLRVEDIGDLHGRPLTACSSASASGATAGEPRARGRATAQAEWAPRAGAVATDGDTPSCATSRRGPAAAESCADRSLLPADGSRTSAEGCAG